MGRGHGWGGRRLRPRRAAGGRRRREAPVRTADDGGSSAEPRHAVSPQSCACRWVPWTCCHLRPLHESAKHQHESYMHW